MEPVASGPEQQQDALIKESWRILNDVIHNGRVTLSNGTLVAPDERGFLSVVQFVAKLRPPKTRKHGGKIRGWTPAETSKAKEA